MTYVLAVDVGGTFVDLALSELPSGRRWIRKVLSRHGPIEAFVSGVELVCADAGIAPSGIGRVVHGLTLATNALLERSESGAAVVTTAGFRDILEIGRHSAVRTGIARWLKPRRPIGRDRVVEAQERMAWDGTVLQPLSDEACNAVVAGLERLGATTVAVGLLHAHANPSHEQALAAHIRAAMPEVKISVSHDVLPQAGEYERVMATLINAYVKPTIGDYLQRLTDELARVGVRAPLHVMSSDGGVLAWRDAAELPITTVMSGPAGGASAAAALAAELGVLKVVALDVGGTSSDVTCADDGKVDVTVDGEISGFPIALPILDVHTVGAGGGSIAAIDDGRFLVGPASAGARPGPACYGGGGCEPTVTDALLLLGWLPDRLAGGAMELSVEAARRVIETRLCGPLGLDLTSGARGILRMANTHMANAIRHVSTERGRDVRDYMLVAFGGAGGLHAVEVAQLVGIRRVLVPPSPGVFTTEGLLAADLRRYFVTSFPRAMPLDGLDVDTLEAAFAGMESQAGTWLEEGASPDARSIERLVDMRYVNQGSELLVPLAPGPINQETLRSAVESFEEAYRVRYRYNMPGAPVEVVRARVLANGRLPFAPPIAVERSRGETGLDGSRPVYFEGPGWLDCPIIIRERLGSGHHITGPAVIQSYDSTVVLPPGTEAKVTENGSIIIACEQHEEEHAR
ncbi:hydantoinase/oxoprolinase family protein [Devosia sp.]|uniref:hydantoinase/oxoprolinase family protein n=1 Tax=Devosia sp. TaxID=1871048 RepID=UPI002EEBCFA3